MYKELLPQIEEILKKENVNYKEVYDFTIFFNFIYVRAVNDEGQIKHVEIRNMNEVIDEYYYLPRLKTIDELTQNDYIEYLYYNLKDDVFVLKHKELDVEYNISDKLSYGITFGANSEYILLRKCMDEKPFTSDMYTKKALFKEQLEYKSDTLLIITDEIDYDEEVNILRQLYKNHGVIDCVFINMNDKTDVLLIEQLKKQYKHVYINGNYIKQKQNDNKYVKLLQQLQKIKNYFYAKIEIEETDTLDEINIVVYKDMSISGNTYEYNYKIDNINLTFRVNSINKREANQFMDTIYDKYLQEV